MKNTPFLISRSWSAFHSGCHVFSGHFRAVVVQTDLSKTVKMFYQKIDELPQMTAFLCTYLYDYMA